MNFKINKVIFNLSNNRLSVNGKTIDCNKNTYEAIQLFLNSKNPTVSKDDLMEYIWGSVIVSDNSIFKLIQNIRTVFLDVGLPGDTIENIYGKGYQIKYPITEINSSGIKTTSVKTKNFKLLFASILIVIISLLVGNHFIELNSEKKDSLTTQNKQYIASLLKSDWEKGLNHIVETLKNENDNLSQSDLAYLYGKKGKAEFHLQKFDENLSSLNHAIMLNVHLKNFESLGHNHLDVADYYEYHTNHSKQINHIEKAIEYFRFAGSTISLIDAQMDLAWMLKKQGEYEVAIETYQQIIKSAKQIDDKMGQMIAINNMASTYNIMNNSNEAIKLAKIGLGLTLELGEGQSIANSYSLLSSLYQQEYHSIKALKMIEESLKFQLKTKGFKNLPPKMLNLSYLLVQTYQFTKANELLKTTFDFAEVLGSKGGIVTINLYKGMNAAHQNNWIEAQHILEKGLQRYQNTTLTYKKPMTMAYLALAYKFTNHHIQAQSMAQNVMNNSKSNKQARAIAALALAHVSDFMENDTEVEKWIVKTEELINKKWLFEYQLLLILKSNIAQTNNQIIQKDFNEEINQLSSEMLILADNAKINPSIFDNLISKVSSHIKKLESRKKAE